MTAKPQANPHTVVGQVVAKMPVYGNPIAISSVAHAGSKAYIPNAKASVIKLHPSDHSKQNTPQRFKLLNSLSLLSKKK